MPTEESVTRADLVVAQKALRDIIVILNGISPGGEKVFYEIGRAVGTARMGVIESGGEAAR